MFQDIYPSVFDNTYRPTSPRQGDVVMVFGKNTVAVKESDGVLELPKYPSVLAAKDDFLFHVDSVAYFGRSQEDIEAISKSNLDGFTFVPLRSTFSKQPKAFPFIIATGYHVVSWKRYHRFCGVCGERLVLSEKERALTCPKCGHTIYPDIHPAVNIAIRNGDKLLLIRHMDSLIPRYSLVAGFIEIGEMAEDTVRREPMEEVGLKVKNIHYFGSQPWGIAGNLQIGFYCDVDGSDEIKVDGTEVREAKWYERSEIPPRDTTSITGQLIEAFRKGKI